MCGIHGVINGSKKIELNSDDFVKQGFIANMLRGTDSAGIGVVDANGYSSYQKLPLAGMYMLGDKFAKKLIDGVRSKDTATMCHVRAATVGGVSYNNAHPFCLETDDGNSILGVHNGTLQNWHNKKHAKDFTVDSEWAMNHILLNGKDAFEDFMGAFAMVWWLSDEPGVLQMARNKERPLYVAWTEDDNMLYASEPGMLHWLAERNRIKLVGSIKTLEENKLYKFDITNPTKFTKEDLPAYKSDYVAPVHQPSTPRYTHETIMDKLTKVFAEVRKQPTQELPAVQVPLLPAPDNARVDKSVTADEMTDAMTLHMMGAKGTFIPYGTDDNTGFLYGTFECMEYHGELNAVMRDCENVMWESLDSYDVTVLGIKDNGNEFMAIVSKPLRQTVEV